MVRRRGASRAGFTLVELMVVVIIIGILSAIAMPLYTRTRYKSFAIEATEVLSRITAAQEGYRSEFSVYSDVSSDLTLAGTGNGTSGAIGPNWWPALTTRDGNGFANFYTSMPTAWNQLGVRPRQMVRYSYQTISGLPGVSPSVGGTQPDLGYPSLPTAMKGVWYYAIASADLDGNGVYSRFEVSNLLPSIRITGETE